MPRFQITIQESAWRDLVEIAGVNGLSAKDQAAELLEKAIRCHTPQEQPDEKRTESRGRA